VAARLLLRAGERESESASGRALLAAGVKAGAVGRTWWLLTVLKYQF